MPNWNKSFSILKFDWLGAGIDRIFDSLKFESK